MFLIFPQRFAVITSCPVTTMSVFIGRCGVMERSIVQTARMSGTVVRNNIYLTFSEVSMLQTQELEQFVDLLTYLLVTAHCHV